jgi:hypothetical protein
MFSSLDLLASCIINDDLGNLNFFSHHPTIWETFSRKPMNKKTCYLLSRPCIPYIAPNC